MNTDYGGKVLTRITDWIFDAS